MSDIPTVKRFPPRQFWRRLRWRLFDEKKILRAIINQAERGLQCCEPGKDEGCGCLMSGLDVLVEAARATREDARKAWRELQEAKDRIEILTGASAWVDGFEEGWGKGLSRGLDEARMYIKRADQPPSAASAKETD